MIATKELIEVALEFSMAKTRKNKSEIWRAYRAALAEPLRPDHSVIMGSTRKAATIT